VPGNVIKAAPIQRPEMIEGFGAREQVGAICEEAGFQSAFLVTDETIFGLSLHEKVTASLEE
jgi:alcohol dehydrogenase class IV